MKDGDQIEGGVVAEEVRGGKVRKRRRGGSKEHSQVRLQIWQIYDCEVYLSMSTRVSLLAKLVKSHLNCQVVKY